MKDKLSFIGGLLIISLLLTLILLIWVNSELINKIAMTECVLIVLLYLIDKGIENAEKDD